MNMRDALAQLRLSGIALEIADEEPYRCGGTRFGGRPVFWLVRILALAALDKLRKGCYSRKVTS